MRCDTAQRRGRRRRSGAVALALILGWVPTALLAAEADTVITDARIYTANPEHRFAQALALSDGRIAAVGSGEEIQSWIGKNTRVVSAAGRVVLPGLVDAHIHPIYTVDPQACDLRNEAQSLQQLTQYVRGCLQKYQPHTGQWLRIYNWNYYDDNQTDDAHPTLRAALDAASTTVPIELIGSDEHHGAFNSTALALARDRNGHVVGFSGATLKDQFRAYRAYVGVDQQGEPNGAVNESLAQDLIDPNSYGAYVDSALQHPEQITDRLKAAGITTILDAAVDASMTPVYDKLAAQGQLTAHVSLALALDPDKYRHADLSVDFDRILQDARRIRDQYASNPLIRADFAKLFADGGIEGNPLADPPTLPNGAVLRPYLQPHFAVNAQREPRVVDYVDTSSTYCRLVQSHPQRYESPEAIAVFRRRHHIHPAQCRISSGTLRYPRAVLMELTRRFHLAGFSIHVHTSGDRAVRTAIDAIEAARATDGNDRTHDSLAHVELADPADVVRMGRDHLYLAYTYWWAIPNPEDMLVIPFLQHVHGGSSAELHRAGTYYENNVYPVRSSLQAGAVLVAGSDAPVASADPMPFYNMMGAILRHEPGGPTLNPRQTISLIDVLDAYTINGARMLGRDSEIGSLAPGKSADFIVIDRDIFDLEKDHHAEDIGKTRVLATWFQGKMIYEAAPQDPARTEN